MLTEVMEFYGFARDFHAAGYYETEHHRQISKEVRAAINAGRLVAVTGMVGCGKTRLLRRLQDELVREGKVMVSKSPMFASRLKVSGASATCGTWSAEVASPSSCLSMKRTTCTAKR
jgi:type II secretory pathway predicted ATPase ExeA